MPTFRLAGLVVFLVPMCLAAQEAPRTVTQMILGASSGDGRPHPSFLIGFELRPARSMTSLRVSAEYSESESHSCAAATSCNLFSLQRGDSWLNFSTFGVQALGVRRFLTGRIQPYLFGGAGLYYSRSNGWASPVTVGDSGFAFLDPVQVNLSRIEPRVLFGTGLSFRIRGVNLFGEAALPTWASNYRFGPQPSLTLGIRF